MNLQREKLSYYFELGGFLLDLGEVNIDFVVKLVNSMNILS